MESPPVVNVVSLGVCSQRVKSTGPCKLVFSGNAKSSDRCHDLDSFPPIVYCSKWGHFYEILKTGRANAHDLVVDTDSFEFLIPEHHYSNSTLNTKSILLHSPCKCHRTFYCTILIFDSSKDVLDYAFVVTDSGSSGLGLTVMKLLRTQLSFF